MVVLAMNCVVGVTQDLRPERVVKGSTITSHRDPAMRIELPHQAQYLGGDRWVLYAVADCEIHVFVEADAKKQVRRMYWIQFEQFIPSRPQLQHNYKPEELTKFAGMEMYVRARFGKSDEVVKQGSDLEHVQALVRAKGILAASRDDECAVGEAVGPATAQRANDHLRGNFGANGRDNR
jgi:hypothetical protein